MNKITFEDYLQEYGVLIYKNKGNSMRPMLKENRDLFTVARKTGIRCKKYDVVLYKRNSKEYVLHRIVDIRNNDYVMLGDNCVNKEYGITDKDIIGVLMSFTHNNKEYKVTDRRYKIYYHIIYSLYPLRRVLWKIKEIIKNSGRKR